MGSTAQVAVPTFGQKMVSLDEVVQWLRHQDIIEGFEAERLVEALVVECGEQAQVDGLVERKLKLYRKRPVGGHDHLFSAFRLATAGRVSRPLVEQIHELMVAGGCYRQVAQTLQLLGREQLTAEEIETMIRAYYRGGSSSSEDDTHYEQLLERLPKGPAKKALSTLR